MEGNSVDFDTYEKNWYDEGLRNGNFTWSQ